MDNRRKSLIAIIATFMIVTIPHIAIYASSFEPPMSSFLGWPYALAVEACIVTCAYFTKWQTTKLWAWIGYFAFVAASGAMNIGYIQPTSFPAWIYAIFPTVAISLLGFLYRQVDKLVYVKEHKTERSGTVPEQKRNVPAHVPVVPEWLEVVPQSKEQFAELYRNSEMVRNMSSSVLSKHLPIGERGIRKWITYAKNGNHS